VLISDTPNSTSTTARTKRRCGSVGAGSGSFLRCPGNLSYTRHRCEESVGAKLPVATCPFCQCVDIRLVFEAEDGLKSYTCHACTRTFHVTELQLAEPETVKASEPLPEKSGQGPKKR
jgi:hypothetical protein